MNKYQALQNFWSGFSLPAYDASSVPTNAQLPYLSYSVSVGALDEPVFMSASIWYRSDSWNELDAKANEIETIIGGGGTILKLDHGFLYLYRGTPFAQRMCDPSDVRIKRIFFNIGAEFLTEH